MGNEDSQPLTLAPELCAAVRQVLREGESVTDFVAAAVRAAVQRRQPPTGSARPVASLPVADELLSQLDAWRQDRPPRGTPT